MSSRKEKKKEIKRKVLESHGLQDKEPSLALMFVQGIILLVAVGFGLLMLVMLVFFILLFI